MVSAHVLKSVVDKHLKTLKHENNKKNSNSNQLIQKTITSLVRNNLNEREMINIEVVEAFTFADIPLEKIEKLKPFLLKHCKNDIFGNQTKLARTEFLPNIKPLYSHLITFINAEYSINNDSKIIRDLHAFCQNEHNIFCAFLSSGRRNPPISNEIENILEETNYRDQFVSLFSKSFASAYEKCEKHLSQHPALLLFKAIQCFNPRFIQSNATNHNMADYGIIEKFYSPTDNLIQEWAIYCGLNEVAEEFIDLN
ncbi:hypothetical protein GLOIN_2v1776946 [Rhizophagus clarus]|uniref:Uncharacterized protein n=1 Tax=Rhizophagus clarus TaxID=94130 RepID=A0A8H3QKA4_9GLOM|nr:hypothetical protein GLOIN_2v1776946 [Rhizophagus clarus]